MFFKNNQTNWKIVIFLTIITFLISGGLLIYKERVLSDIISICNAPEAEIKRPAKKPKKEPVYLKLFEDKKNEFVSKETDFLEIHLAEMKIRLYKKGILEKEVSFLKRGDAKEWGGSATGLYKLMSGNKLSFSLVAEVYMPYALRYYGKYYIHGEPYYPGGQKTQYDISGGCISLKDEDAKTIFELAEINMPVLVIDKERDSYKYNTEKITDFPELTAKSYLVSDLDSGYVFAEKDSKSQLPLASLAKLVTATVVAESIDLKKSIWIKKEMLDAGYGSTKGLEAGKSFRVVELFYPLLIESSNDAAEALSYFLGRKKTIQLMNEKAKSILMAQTVFVGPSGFEPENVSTAQDLFYLARYVLNVRPLFLEISKGKKVLSFGEVNFDIKEFWNKNVFIDDPTFVGGKAGFIKASKQTALFIFRFTDKDNTERNVVITLLGSDNIETDAQKTYIWLQDNFFKINHE
jgi:D-alanyl-D-alanine carboxypeptidase